MTQVLYPIDLLFTHFLTIPLLLSIVFLDLPAPWDAVAYAKKALRVSVLNDLAKDLRIASLI